MRYLIVSLLLITPMLGFSKCEAEQRQAMLVCSSNQASNQCLIFQQIYIDCLLYSRDDE